jgi:translation initiation factor 2 subunit 2
LNENNPDLVKSKKGRYVMQPPQVFREGTKKTVWANFKTICDMYVVQQREHQLQQKV